MNCLVKMAKKRGIMWGQLLTIILGVVVILFVADFLYGGKIKDAALDVWKYTMYGQKDFVPYEEQFSEEERIVANSITALQMAINSIAKEKFIYGSDKNPQEDVLFDYYTISFSGRVELEETGRNDYRNWNFVKRFDINQVANEIEAQAEEYIFADYHYGSCSNSNEGNWINCNGRNECYCNDEDDYSPNDMYDINIDQDLIREAKAANLAPVRDITPIYNVELTVHYKDGKECKIGTQDKGKKITDIDAENLLVWGATSVESCYGNPNFKKGDGCDRDGDGIQGAYGSRFYGMKWQEVIIETNKNIQIAEEKTRLVSPRKIAKYFPEGIIQSTSPNGESCLDSPTWLECPGVKIYYCGKLGYKSLSQREESKYYFHMDGMDNKVHSNAGIKILREINKAYTQQQTSQNRADNNNIEIRDKDATRKSTWLEGAWQYAREHDIDVVLGTFGAVVGGIVPLAMKKLDDPSVYCYNGKKINEGPTIVKCDARRGCGVCNFELPQNISRDYDSALTWFAGYGDPKYVVYYEAFPDGEDEPWILSPLDVSFTTIALTNVVAHGGMPIGGYVLKQGWKLAKLFGRATYHIPIVGKVIKLTVWAGKMPFKALSFVANRASRLIKAGVERGTKTTVAKVSKEYYLKLFTKSDDILRVISKNPETAGKIGANLDDVVKLMQKGAKSPDELVKLGITENVDDLLRIPQEELIEKMTAKGVSKEVAEATETLIVMRYALKTEPALEQTAKEMAEKLAKMNLIKKGVAKTAQLGFYYAAAIPLAWEDSRNQKFMPIGVNSIGMKKPYLVAFTKKLDTKTNRYIIMLRKDKFKGGKLTNVVLEQADTRFYLASPCKANLALVKANKECWEISGEVEDRNGNKIEITLDIPEGEARDKYGYVPFLAYTVDKDYPDKTDPRRYENAVKECVDKTAGFKGLSTSIGWESPKYNTEAIIVNPIPYGNRWDEYNFCYGGSHTLTEMGKLSIILGTIGLGVATEVIATSVQAGAAVACPFTIGLTCVAIPIVEIVQTGADIGIDVAAAYTMNKVAKGSKWPNH